MHPRATLAVSAPPASSEETAQPVASTTLVKPKVLRRPAQFSTPAAQPIKPEATDTRIDATQTPAQTAASPVLRPWQDDARFACALLAIVILVNLALSIWLAPNVEKPRIAATPLDTNLNAAAQPFSSPAQSPEEALLFHLGEAGANVSEQ